MPGQRPAPDTAQQLGRQAAALLGSGSFAELETLGRRIIAAHPQWPTGWKALGAALSGQNLHEQALQAKTRATELAPGDAEAHANLANTQWRLGLVAQAIESHARAAATDPHNPQRHAVLGGLLRGQQRMHAAAAAYRRALQLQPGSAELWNDLANTLHDLGHLADADAAYRQAIERSPLHARIHSNHGNVLRDMGRLDEAIACYQRALRLDPAYLGAHNNLLLALNFSGQSSPAARFDAALAFGQAAARLVGTDAAAPPRAPRRAPGTPLRVGLVSGDLRNHPVGYFLQAWLKLLDPARVQLHAFATHTEADALTQALRPCFATWTSIAALDDAQAVHCVRSQRIDVLMDLSGHTAHNRLALFARRAAPVQVSWLGYFATTGLQAMDYLLSDWTCSPANSAERFSETVWRLGRTRLCFAPPAEAPPVAPLPAMQRGFVTFGCFQTTSKLNDAVLAAWAGILQAMPSARLRIQSTRLGNAAEKATLAARLAALGVAAHRIDLHGRALRPAYLAAHAEVDMILDTFPYPGGTTTCEALWMGVPTLTLAGDRLIARQGAGLLAAAGLGDWVAGDVPTYIQQAVQRASDLPGLAVLRATLRERVAASALCDAQGFAQDITQALQAMAQGEPPPAG
ncbi:MAG: tetratricopeptide repeat protein [Proteobacteria bacterium]|nr:tetratricopeptide repeat protein [Pseudomonadota bacterium]